MPASFDIASSVGRYDVRIEQGLFQSILAEPADRVFIVDDFLQADFDAAGIDCISIFADEHAKALDRITDIITGLRERGATRGTTIVAVGGGVVQDVAAFAAAIYMRGVSWVYVPTTLLSMTDSCIGGKSSINVGAYKNIVGTFHPPGSVLIDPALVRTLDQEQWAAGLMEAAKICFCRGFSAFDAYMALGPDAEVSDETLTALIDHSLRNKKWFIEIDEFDRSERLLLNFGHTFGHAIEAASNFAVSHGIAVGLGMQVALRLGALMNRDYALVEHVSHLERHIDDLLRLVPNLAAALADVDVAGLMDAFRSDKKHSRENYVVIVVDERGSAERLMMSRDAASNRLIENAFEAVMNDWKCDESQGILAVESLA